MKRRSLGKLYESGECILYEGDPAEYLFIVQAGQVELAFDEPDRVTRMVLLHEGDLFGESALFSRDPRTANARAVGDAMVMTVDRHVMLRRLRQDPLLALELLRSMHQRIARMETTIKDLHRRLRSASGNGSSP